MSVEIELPDEKIEQFKKAKNGTRHWRDLKSQLEGMSKSILEEVATRKKDRHEFDHLKYARILWTWRVPNRFIADNRIALASTRRCQIKERDLYGFDFEIEVGLQTWKMMPERARRMTIHHEMKHIGIDLDEDGRPFRDNQNRVMTSVIPHEVVIEGFHDLWRQYGLEPSVKRPVRMLAALLNL